MKKKIISLILTFVMLIGMIPTNVFADETTSESRFSFTTNKDTVHVGEEFTVTISLDEAIKKAEDITNFQCELYYDNSVIEYVSHEFLID